ncbi:hypothetical protein STENM36S_07992 [Streptomyces tendae]
MRFRLTPRETSFYDMFAASADNIVTGSKLLMELLGADASARAEIAERMRAAEHAGDDATHAIFHQLISTTHVITSAIMGVGATKRVNAVRWGVAKNIIMGWFITMPAAALVAAVSFWIVNLAVL